ncbi:CSLREA domain-containing protein [Synechococcus sp. Nb3U1]|uniref:CSLREA domain-containing protein n=1 Tax=Synechococcus sp. Nb3U1 TaxID=1914529 RepID=UPI001F2F7A42|nr:CSLREA domain-containing protein [Synechococcus sp. Nb3U1]MCF2971503.1 CSLREA domain-containing protein [Synechococcus sp. Nb3U1]
MDNPQLGSQGSLGLINRGKQGRMWRWLSLAGSPFVGLLLWVNLAEAATLIVNSAADVVADDGECTLREAIFAANGNIPAGSTPGECAAGELGGDIILFSSEMIGQVVTVFEALPELSEELIIRVAGSTEIDRVTVQREITNPSEFPIFRVAENITATFENLTLRGGRATGYASGGGIGGGSTIVVSNSTFIDNIAGLRGGAVAGRYVSVSGSIFLDNKAAYGGGVGATFSATVTNSSFRGNSALNRGGGVYAQEQTATVTDSTLTNNSASSGGGISAGGVNVARSTLTGNTASNSGGGVYGRVGAAIVESLVTFNVASFSGGGGSADFIRIQDSTLSGNFAGNRGGAAYGLRSVRVINSTLSGNSTNESGGGVSALQSLEVNNSTIVFNRAKQGGGVNFLSVDSFSLDNSIVAGNTNSSGNTPDEIRGTATGSHNLIGDTETSGGLINGSNGNLVGIASEDLGLGPLANNGGFQTGVQAARQTILTHAPQPGSSVINAGDNSLIPAEIEFDQRGVGFPRILNGTVDMGALESELTPPPPTPSPSPPLPMGKPPRPPRPPRPFRDGSLVQGLDWSISLLTSEGERSGVESITLRAQDLKGIAFNFFNGEEATSTDVKICLLLPAPLERLGLSPSDTLLRGALYVEINQQEVEDFALEVVAADTSLPEVCQGSNGNGALVLGLPQGIPALAEGSILLITNPW